MGTVIGLTIVSIIYSPLGKRSGGHINPAMTLTFWWLGKIKPWDVVFYMTAQFLGAVTGVWLSSLLLTSSLADPAVNYVVTEPGSAGIFIAFVAEFTIALAVMLLILFTSNNTRLHNFTGVLFALTVAACITFESPLSGTSMNPARTIGSAVSAGSFHAIWIYFVAPLMGMLLAAAIYSWTAGEPVKCAKLFHDHRVPCIFNCGHRPKSKPSETDN